MTGTTRRLHLGLLSLIVGLAAVLRWYAIGRSSIWIDEGASITLARMPWDRFVQTLWQYEINMTSYYLTLRAWMHLGDSEAIIRSLSALLGTVSVVAIYLLGRRLLGERVGLVAAAFLSVNMLHVWYSQEARGYSLAVLLVIVSLLLFVEAVENPKKRWLWVGYLAVSVLAVYAHLFALLVLAAQWLALGPRRLRQIGLLRLGGVGLALGLPLAPLAVFLLRPDQGQLEWIPPISVGQVVLTLFAVCGGNPIVLVLVLIGLTWVVKSSTRSRDAAFGMRLLALAFVLPLAVVALASLFRPLFFFRHFAICLPPAALIAARVATPARPLGRRKRGLVLALVVLTVGASCLATGQFYFGAMNNWAGDWRGATEHVMANRRTDDAILFHYSAGLDAYHYYEDRVPSSGGPTQRPTVVFPEAGDIASVHLVPDPARLRKASEGHPRLWVVLHQKSTEDLPASFLDSYRRIDQDVFPGMPTMDVTVELYEVGRGTGESTGEDR